MLVWIIVAILFLVAGLGWFTSDVLDIVEARHHGQSVKWYTVIEWRSIFAMVMLGFISPLFYYSRLFVNSSPGQCIAGMMGIMATIQAVLAVGTVISKLRKKRYYGPKNISHK